MFNDEDRGGRREDEKEHGVRNAKGSQFKMVMSGLIGTDIAKISRKRSKPDNHGHGNGIENIRAGRMLSKSITSPNALFGQSPQGNATWIEENTWGKGNLH
ncbi:hypothetical protein Tco_1256094 [Tanacetum coccineum]